jgi:hypothetical protein
MSTIVEASIGLTARIRCQLPRPQLNRLNRHHILKRTFSCMHKDLN